MKLILDNYSIYLNSIEETLSHFLNQKTYSQYFILVDENTQAHCLPKIKSSSQLSNATIIGIKSGEINKNLNTCQHIWSCLLAANADRNALLINLGGGVIGDMGGFAASCYKRGISFVQIPTTLLAQVDASIGGKLGVDYQNVKNIIGCFNNPEAVFIDPTFLQSLSLQQIQNGFAEIIKHALIADADYWTQLQTIKNFSTTNWTPIIYQSLCIKKNIVNQDPYEKGLRKVLNFGHTLGHAVESYSLQHDTTPLLHGEAIAIGMVMENYLSYKKLGFDKQQMDRVNQFLLHLYPNYPLPKNSHEALITYLKNDKKNDGLHTNFSLLKTIGNAQYNQYLNTETIKEALEYYQNLLTL